MDLNETEYQFTLQVITDGSVTYSRKYNNALEAVQAYERISDWGFAINTLEAVLVEPNGKIHDKMFERPRLVVK